MELGTVQADRYEHQSLERRAIPTAVPSVKLPLTSLLCFYFACTAVLSLLDLVMRAACLLLELDSISYTQPPYCAKSDKVNLAYCRRGSFHQTRKELARKCLS